MITPKQLVMGFAALLTLVAGARAQQLQQPPGKWWKDPQVVQTLKLTSDQQDRIEAVFRKYRRDLIDQKARLDRCRVDLEEVLSKPSVEESAALAAFDSLQNARQEVERTTFMMRLQIRNLLSAEQQKKLEELAAGPRPQKPRG